VLDRAFQVAAGFRQRFLHSIMPARALAQFFDQRGGYCHEKSCDESSESPVSRQIPPYLCDLLVSFLQLARFGRALVSRGLPDRCLLAHGGSA